MRTRRSNKTKKFTNLGLTGDGESSDDAVADPDKHEIEVTSHATSRENNDGEEISSDEAASDNDGPSETPNRRRAAAPAAPVAAGRRRRSDCHELPTYPFESRNLTRVYTGKLQRHSKYSITRDLMYGPEYERVKLIWDLLERWLPYQVLPAGFPPKHPQGVLPTPWVPTGFETSQREAASKWYGKYRADPSAVQQQSRTMQSTNSQPFIHGDEGEVIALLGPWDSQKEYRLKRGDAMVLSSSNTPINDAGNADSTPTGWIFDVGGLVVALGWAPLVNGSSNQVLALAVIPHSDHVPRQADDKDSAPEEQKEGSIQFWGFHGESGQEERATRPSRELPKFLAAKCFDWGRPTRLQWCPVSLEAAEACGMFAILCGDKRVRVIEVEALDYSSDATRFEYMESPLATLGELDEYNIHPTCLTWVGINRLALGHSDGTVTLWSLYPCQLLQRYPVHSSFVLDISSGYPSHPYLITSVPLGGITTLTDFSKPSSETTCITLPTIALQPGLLSWNDHMQGWMAMYPSAGAGITTVAFLSSRYFCHPRTMASLPAAPMSLSASGAHPYVLVGCADGSLWSFNALSKLFRLKNEKTFKMKVAEHEFRAVDAFGQGGSEGQNDGPPLRGAARILQGFRPVVNGEFKIEGPDPSQKKGLKAKSTSGKKRGRPSKKQAAEGAEEGEYGESDDGTTDGAGGKVNPRYVVHDPLTRVTAVSWNPNADFGCWAAVALGSGLVRVMDLGVV